MAQRVKDLAVKTREYTDKEGNRKANWQKIGVVMRNDDGGEFIILDRWVNLSGVPDFKNPNSASVTVSVFDINKQNNYQPPKQKGDPSFKGQDHVDDDIPF